EVAFGRRRSLLTRISDGTGALTVRLFHFSKSQQANLNRGRWVRCFGEVRRGRATLEMVHPEYRVSDAAPEIEKGAGLTPIYPLTEGIGQAALRRMVERGIAEYLGQVTELLPEAVLNVLGYPTLREALAYVHHPPTDADQERLGAGIDPAQQRLAFEELLAHHLSLRLIRRHRRTHRAPKFKVQPRDLDAFWAQLGFSPTAAQRRVTREILQDLERAQPMLRLVQGDVGSGKTVVAAAAAVGAATNGFQTAIMAPTELLAEQHAGNFAKWLAPLGIDVGFLSGRTAAAERRALHARLLSGDLSVVAGTHALFQSGVEFAHLGLVIVDEQHRFGVDQRLALRDKGRVRDQHPHQLIMTATPIPRTLAMTFYADLDVSSIDELPPGRKPVETVVIPETRRRDVVYRVERACAQGRQAYWVCPLIDESDTLQAQAATDLAARLSEALPEIRVELIHGRMKAADKDRVMQRFRAGDVDLLVATTVIEVGVDVPNASLMIIENAERLGLSQLHQLRGRVGRGRLNACCVLMYRPPLGQHARVRLAALKGTTDGFEIALHDLELRGPGEVLGTRQTGLQELRVAELARDRGLLPRIEEIGRLLLDRYPDRAAPLIRRWVGETQDYANV
ncbi:MAG: ATP-dependent DNA helicase RecG, partial [Gammaproteobacteria bacterium]|nr:ATP-dependent DNA helicase RecG [Gammaproteobacteria bacterium]